MAKTEFKLAVLALIEEASPGFNPIKKMVNLHETSLDEGIKFNCLKELAGYVYAKQRPIDENGKSGGDVTINILQFSNQPIPLTKDTVYGEVITGEVLSIDSKIPEPEEELVERDNSSYK